MTKIKFNHKRKSTLKAIGCKQGLKSLNKKLNSMTKDFMLSKGTHQSRLAEMIHNRLSYNEILFLASEELKNKILQSIKESESRSIDEFLAKIIENKNEPTNNN